MSVNQWGRLPWVTAAVLALWVGVLGYLAVIPEQALPPPALAWLIEHRFGALVVAGLSHLLLVPWRPRWPLWKTALLAWGLVVAGGFVLELVQLTVPARGQEFADLVDNAIGATLGVAISSALVALVANRRVLVAVTTGLAALALALATFTAVRYQPEPPSSCPPEGELFRPVGEPLAIYDFSATEDGVANNLAQETDSELVIDGGELGGSGGINETAAGWEFTGGTGIAQSPNSAGWLLCNIIPADVITFAAWYTPADITQEGPTRLVAFSEGTDDWEANVHLGQEGTMASLRIRNRPERQEFRLVEDVFTEPDRPYHLVMWFVDGELSLAVDGEVVFTDDVGRDIKWWSDFYPLNVGNEFTRDRGLKGTLHHLAIRNQVPTQADLQNWFAQKPPGIQ